MQAVRLLLHARAQSKKEGSAVMKLLKVLCSSHTASLHHLRLSTHSLPTPHIIPFAVACSLLYIVLAVPHPAGSEAALGATPTDYDGQQQQCSSSKWFSRS